MTKNDEWLSTAEYREKYLGRKIRINTNTISAERVVKEDKDGFYVKLINQKSYIKIKEEVFDDSVEQTMNS